MKPDRSSTACPGGSGRPQVACPGQLTWKGLSETASKGLRGPAPAGAALPERVTEGDGCPALPELLLDPSNSKPCAGRRCVRRGPGCCENPCRVPTRDILWAWRAGAAPARAGRQVLSQNPSKFKPVLAGAASAEALAAAQNPAGFTQGHRLAWLRLGASTHSETEHCCCVEPAGMPGDTQTGRLAAGVPRQCTAAVQSLQGCLENTEWHAGSREETKS